MEQAAEGQGKAVVDQGKSVESQGKAVVGQIGARGCKRQHGASKEGFCESPVRIHSTPILSLASGPVTGSPVSTWRRKQSGGHHRRGCVLCVVCCVCACVCVWGGMCVVCGGGEGGRYACACVGCVGWRVLCVRVGCARVLCGRTELVVQRERLFALMLEVDLEVVLQRQAML